MPSRCFIPWQTSTLDKKMLPFINRKKPLLTVTVGNKTICDIAESEPPVEKTPLIKIREGEEVVFADRDGNTTIHKLQHEGGWAAFSIRLYPNFACQSDFIYGNDRNLSAERFKKGELMGVRFQPFFVTEGRKIESDLIGRGLFRRGLHFSGTITPGNVSLSCICDNCHESFRIQSFHAGFSQCGYMYSESGLHTLTFDESLEGAPPSYGEGDIQKISKFEDSLPVAPDGSKFKYLNPFRCPHCKSAFIDFEKFPEDRANEYYGNTYYGEHTIRHEP